MKQSRQENLLYIAVWGMLFAAPLLSLYVRTVSDANMVFNWEEVFFAWRRFAIYLLLFLVHNFLLAPMLVHGRKRILYFSMVAIVVAAFAVFQYNTKPVKHFGRQMPPPHEMMRHERPDGMMMRRPHEFNPDRRPPIVAERDIMSVMVVILMFGANLGTKAYIRSREDRRRLVDLERQNLEHQLEYLRYQINPHFFMNTLNNIHALIDIDPVKAQETIVELSKMMRYVLYDVDKHGVPLTKEMAFISTYVKLMRLRYTDKVNISLSLPDEVPDKTIPPLILISFIENAFKHGVSYQHDSFIDIKVVLEGESLMFICRNSKAEVSNQEKGGVGLSNVRKRLNLLYAHNYTLRIHDDSDVYTIELNIPLS